MPSHGREDKLHLGTHFLLIRRWLHCSHCVNVHNYENAVAANVSNADKLAVRFLSHEVRFRMKTVPRQCLAKQRSMYRSFRSRELRNP